MGGLGETDSEEEVLSKIKGVRLGEAGWEVDGGKESRVGREDAPGRQVSEVGGTWDVSGRDGCQRHAGLNMGKDLLKDLVDGPTSAFSVCPSLDDAKIVAEDRWWSLSTSVMTRTRSSKPTASAQAMSRAPAIVDHCGHNNHALHLPSMTIPIPVELASE